jgi:twitching motility protein PilT
LVDHINETQQWHILTIEDPIEFVHQPKVSLINQREVGSHTHGFGNALRSALREDPDVI